MPHLQWVDPSWGDEPCGLQEANTREREMQGILSAINKLIGYDPNSPSAKARVLAEKTYFKSVDKAKRDFDRAMTQALHDYHKARAIKGCDMPAIERRYAEEEDKATKKYSRAKSQAGLKLKALKSEQMPRLNEAVKDD